MTQDELYNAGRLFYEEFVHEVDWDELTEEDKQFYNLKAIFSE